MNVNGMNVTYTDDQGVSRSLFAGADFPLWGKLMENSDLQAQAARDNTNAQAAYLTNLHTYQTYPDKAVMPIKPKMKVVSDMGTVSTAEFVPALPDPVVPNAATPAPSSGSIKSAAPPVPLTDFEKTVLSALGVQQSVLAKISTKLGL